MMGEPIQDCSKNWQMFDFVSRRIVVRTQSSKGRAGIAEETADLVRHHRPYVSRLGTSPGSVVMKPWLASKRTAVKHFVAELVKSFGGHTT